MKRRAIAGIVALFVLVAFAALVPAVPASANSSHRAAPPGQPCPANALSCLEIGGPVQGYGSITYLMTGRGAFYYQGSYAIATSDNFSITVG